MTQININLNQSQLPPDLSNLIMTSWEFATFNDFSMENYILGRSLENKTETEAITYNIDSNKLVNSTIYYRFKFHFNQIDSEGWSKVYSYTIPDTNLPSVQALIQVPKIVSEIFYVKENNEYKGYVKLTASEYNDYNKKSTHNKSYWGIENTLGSGIISEIVKTNEQTDERGLRKLILPVETFQDDDIYNVTLKYESNTNVNSPIASHKFETYTGNGMVKHKVVDGVIAGKLAYFEVNPQTMQFKDISLKLRDTDGVVIAEKNNQETITPKLMIPADLNQAKAYELVGQIRRKDDTVGLEERMELMKILSNSIREIDPSVVYKDKFTDMGTISNENISVNNGVEIGENMFLVADSRRDRIDLFEMKNEKLVFVKTAITVINEVGIMYLNVVKRYDGRIVINYAKNNKLTNNSTMVFELYEFNPVSLTFELNGFTEQTSTMFSTAVSSSMFVAPNNDIYFVPAGEKTEDRTPINVKLSFYKLDGELFTIKRLLYVPNTIIRYLSFAPTTNPNVFIVFGGCKKEYVVDGKKKWKRETNKIYTFDTSKPLAQLDLLEGIDLSGISDEYYNLVGYLRKDGKIAIFNNNTREGYDRQLVWTLDIEAKTIELVPNTDTDSNYRFRSTLVTNDGEFIRISTSSEVIEHVHRYVADSIPEVVNPGGGEAKTTLTIGVGKEVIVDDIYIYDKIKVLGDSVENTGKLVLTHTQHQGTYDFRTLFVIGDTRVTIEDNANVENIISLNGIIEVG